MSALIAHAKAYRILAEQLTAQALVADSDLATEILAHMAAAHDRTADALEAKARDECSGTDERAPR